MRAEAATPRTGTPSFAASSPSPSESVASSEAESSLTDILVWKPSSCSAATSGNLNPNVMFELFSMYREWQEEKAKKISQTQTDKASMLDEIIDSVKFLQLQVKGSTVYTDM
ncbi:hypothetical protein E2562_014466 [Oryza meyeriana var. granulata]|uniref:Uncharacterized protein n=1 Tax=Oryza meyeriana var. granulata TaxID=110450 RepID=A0A6G1CQ72_9ORYZ|nr:hypothetical protein E2562_014466 [Oryza meyeriana var. granulata]